MNIEFHLGWQDDLIRCIYSKKFPDNINFHIGETIDIEGFYPLFTKGALYYPELHENNCYMDIDNIQGSIGEITDIQHAFIEEVGYIMMVHIDLK